MQTYKNIYIFYGISRVNLEKINVGCFIGGLECIF